MSTRTIFYSAAVLLTSCSSIQAVFSFELGGLHIGKQSESDQQKKSDLPPDDPLVNEDTPPPSDASPLIKVGWCEVQVFGHTFSDASLQEPWVMAHHMSLPKRLEQLNYKLHFELGKSGVQLMDNIDALVKYVNDHRKPTTSPASE